MGDGSSLVVSRCKALGKWVWGRELEKLMVFCITKNGICDVKMQINVNFVLKFSQNT